MIIITDHTRPFSLTSKGIPRRRICLEDYKEEVDGTYKHNEGYALGHIPLPLSANEPSVAAYVREVVLEAMKVPYIGDEDDLFQHGCDR